MFSSFLIALCIPSLNAFPSALWYNFIFLAPESPDWIDYASCTITSEWSLSPGDTTSTLCIRLDCWCAPSPKYFRECVWKQAVIIYFMLWL